MGDLAICPVVIRRTDVPDELAISTTSFRMSFLFRGRPTLISELSYFRAAICRNHPKIVPGFTIWQHFFRSSGLNAFPATASRRR
jgi:hypothetical protein